MKRLLFAIWLSLFVFFPLSGKADEGWTITDFASALSIQPDGTLTVAETIAVDFGSLQKHGIFRDMPLLYELPSSGKVYTEVTVLDVTRGGTAEPFEVTKSRANLRIRIGDPDTTISGIQRYRIEYTVRGVLRSFEGFDELYWNVTGNDWPVMIERASALVSLPREGMREGALCFVGVVGSPEECGVVRTSSSAAQFESTRPLVAGEGLSVVTDFASGLVPVVTLTPPRGVEEMVRSLATLLSFLVTLGIGIFSLIRRWWRHGRDLRYTEISALPESSAIEQVALASHETIVAEYDPPGTLRPAEIGVLIDERADTLDVSATIVDLAVRGYLTITEIEKKWIFGKTDYLLTRTDKETGDLLSYEQLLLDSLFATGREVRLSELKNTFYDDLAKVKRALYEEITQRQLFTKNPHAVRNQTLLIGVIVAIVGGALLILGGISVIDLLFGGGAALSIVGVLFLIFAFAMPSRTAQGRELFRRAKGYKLFVSGTEKYRQPFFERENIFMEVLPYAIVFGVTKRLANAMSEMGIKPPEPAWYYGAYPFSVAAFSAKVDSFSHSLSTAIARAPGGSGSGGGGFSGGGFGGGGGGSW
ncbi:MAG: DUF2207 domain-containing protein [Parcubacteria group bacterium]|nr:DUF2207 domain-containing protein [Parcubacteria group bacterium]